VPPQWATPSKPHMSKLKALTLFANADLDGCVPAALGGKGPSMQGILLAPSGKVAQAANEATKGTNITGFCR